MVDSGVSQNGREMMAGRRFALPALLGVAAAAGWFVFHDDTELGTAVFGAYRQRWFLLNAILTYASALGFLLASVRPRRRTQIRLLAAHLAAFMALGAAEGVAVVGLVDYRAFFQQSAWRATSRTNLPPGLRHASLPGSAFEGEVFPDLVSVLGVEAQPVAVKFQRDANGFRNPRPKPEARVVCLGDSVLVAGLVPVESIVTEDLGRRLGLDVLNASEVAYAPQEELIRLQTSGVSVKGRLVVHFLFEGNDLGDSAEWRAWGKRPVRTSYPKSGLLKQILLRMSGPRRNAGARRRGTITLGDGAPIVTHFLYDATSTAYSMYEWPHLKEGIADGARWIADAGGTYALAFVPHKFSVLGPKCTWPVDSDLAGQDAESSPFRDAVAQFAGESGVPFHDLTVALRALAESGVMPFPAADSHPNAAGHAAMAQSLAPWVRDLLPD